MKKKKWMVFLVLVLGFIIAGCSSDGSSDGNQPDGTPGETQDGTTGDVVGFEHITGIEPGAGVVAAAEEAIDVYGLDIELVPSSSAIMAADLAKAIENEEWIVVTGWSPHWKFAAFDLKYLDDPEGVFGGEEAIHTIVRQGLADDHPEAYQVLDNFYWTTDDMESIMLDIYENDTDPRVAAQTWIDNNREKVEEWIAGVNPVDQEDFNLVYVAWDSEIASTNVVALVLEEVGYHVEITPVENTAMWQAVANGTHDAMVAAWLPGTHAAQYAEFQDQIEDLGPNLEGAKIGLVVPTYVTIDSIAEITAR